MLGTVNDYAILLHFYLCSKLPVFCKPSSTCAISVMTYNFFLNQSYFLAVILWAT
jgi:hypothetical protein